MIRGAIEIAQKARVVGWIYSSMDSIRGKTILAFSGDRCVGAGDVSVFRQDLLDAQLGDGYCGFDFPIRLTDAETVGSVYVRLQFSDAALLQQTSRVVGLDDDTSAGPDFGRVSPASVAWLMERGMLDQTEYDFLKAIHAAGAYERNLRMSKRGAAEASIQRLEPEAVAQDLLGLMMMGEVTVSSTSFASVSDIVPPPKGAAPLIALWSQERVRITLDERSHLGIDRQSPRVLFEAPSAGIECGFGRDKLLFLHRDVRFAPKGTAPISGIVVFTGIAADADAEASAQDQDARAA